MRLLLFDVDGTLLRCGRQVRVLFAEALHEVFGTCGDLDAYDFSGKTDPLIVRELMTAAGVPVDEVRAAMPRMRDAYLERLEARLGAVEVIPGVVEALAALAGRADVAVGLVTGNWQRGAGAKLGRAGLWERFAFGAFGDDGEDRALLPPLAIERACAATGYPFTAAEALIIGDSLEDVRCAQACNVPLLAVASGWTSTEQLRAAGAERVVERLDTALDWLLADALSA
ncbi:MAG TPA: HAD hydrolase-like protein [Thermoanaerobaculia bacterium]|jgi:phosphoglycolate phosphatase-like HAD superfamily hydrolase|nr:HAD hydrolase-like protein [Thermoanaerobaculia bacterium]